MVALHTDCGNEGTAQGSVDNLTCPPGLVTRLSDESEALLGRLDTLPVPIHLSSATGPSRSCVRANRPNKSPTSSASAPCLRNWVRQDRIDRGELDGVAISEPADLRAARKRIRELETELAIIRQASNLTAVTKTTAG